MNQEQEKEVYSLIYKSTATADYDEAKLDQLLEISRQRNEVNRITGLLLLVDKTFVQLLQGEKSKVIETFNRIEQDARHKDIVIVTQGVLANNIFNQWRMAFRLVDNSSEISAERAALIKEKIVKDSDSSHLLLELFESYCRIQSPFNHKIPS